MSQTTNIFSRATLIAAIGALGVASPALAADTDPYVTSAPAISGAATVGNTLNAVGGVAGGTSITKGYQWMRCTSPTDEDACDLIDNANATSYKLTSADLGKRMRVSLFAYRYFPWDLTWKTSVATAAVAAAPTPTPTPTRTPTPTPTRTPTPTPVKTATPTPTPVKTPTPTPTPVKTPTPPPATKTPTPAPTAVATAVGGVGGTVGEATPTPVPAPVATPDVAAAPVPTAVPNVGAVLSATDTRRPPMIRPFPVVRVSGVLTVGGAKIQRLTVTAPKGANITLKCAGGGCPTKRLARAAKVIHLQKFETDLPAGIKLTIIVSKPGYISKVTTLQIRKGKAPLRNDACQLPGTTKLSRCPK